MPKTHSPYQFPLITKLQPTLDLIHSKSDAQIISSVHKFSMKTSTRSTINYMKERETLCALHVVLNERGLIAPNFRPFVKLTKHRGLTPIEIILGRDNQIFNLHYLYAQHFGRFRPNEKEYQNLFSTDEFDFNLAEKYALEEWKADTYAKYSMMLDDNTMMELSTFRSETVRNRLKSIYESVRTMKRKVVNYSATPNSRLSIDKLPKLIDEYECLKYADGSPSMAANFYKLKTGTAISSSDKNSSEYMRRKKVWFEKTMNVASW